MRLPGAAATAIALVAVLPAGAHADADYGFQIYGGVVAWAQQIDSGTSFTYRVPVVQSGRLRTLTLGGQSPYVRPDFGLGPGPDGRPVAVFSACVRSSRRCRIKLHDLTTDKETTVKRFKTPCGAIKHVSIWRKAVSFVRLERSRNNRGKLKCRSSQDGNYGASSLVRVGLRRGSRQRRIARLVVKDNAIYEFEYQQLVRGLLIWQERASDHLGAYVSGQLMLANLATGQRCQLARTGGTKYPFDPSTFVTGIAVVGSTIVWGVESRIDQMAAQQAFSQNGCGQREDAGNLGRLLNAVTFLGEAPSDSWFRSEGPTSYPTVADARM
jgi:hypothetical protein